MSSTSLPSDKNLSLSDRRNVVLKLIGQLFPGKSLEVLDPQTVLKTYKKPSATNSTTGNGNLQGQYTCVTEKFDTGSVASILVGMLNEIPRWKYGSVVNFATYANGYPNPDDAKYAAVSLWEAAEQWNSYNLGVTFKWVNNLKQATFVLEYGGKKDRVMASAFFPNNQPLNTMSVYSYSFTDKESHETLKNTFLHELGHTLGLRHEFALDPDRFEGGAEVYGTRNDHSVMSYTLPPQVQKSDIEDIKSFYKLPADVTLPVDKKTSSAQRTMIIKDYIPA
ncbi:hypothetical protein V2G26_002522 [Clonostachys chloroleuca]|uniref:Peptidase metallopeptidase domain-containing protein n=1 Tax=Clonostachys chloroleuca TaxID=1926264 RepID=A0AA35M2P9_9HYPO|nr:unnamed protein product [Clonostachys chloroleuca]